VQWEETLLKTPGTALRWLELSWQMIETTLNTWTVADLAQTYRHIREGKIYTVTRQWTIWRVLSHDLHHGGQLARPDAARLGLTAGFLRYGATPVQKSYFLHFSV
jgi:hypothetical protein